MTERDPRPPRRRRRSGRRSGRRPDPSEGEGGERAPAPSSSAHHDDAPGGRTDGVPREGRRRRSRSRSSGTGGGERSGRPSWGGRTAERDDPRDDRPPTAEQRPRHEPGARVRQLEPDEIDDAALDRDARRVVFRLQRSGFEAYFVGGCVRDLMIGRRPKDFDVATSATPNEIRRLFRNGRIIGRRFRLVHIHYGDHIIETSTFRREPEAQEDDEDLLIREDNEFGSAAEDARRRDFTVNGLFLDPGTLCIHDWVGGLDDLEDRVLCTIGDPQVRFAEDPVRIMRAIKFATRLDFEIDPETWEAMCDQAGQLSRAAPPRVLEELLRLLRSGSGLGAFKMLRACGALRVLLPALDAYLGPRSGGTRAQEDRASRFWRLLEAFDSRVHQGVEPTAALCIAVLFAPVVELQSDPELRTLPGEPGDLEEVAWEVLEPVARSTRLSRRDFGRARQVLVCQPTFLETVSPHFSPLLFALEESFDEALELFGLRVQARGKGWDIFEAWQERARRAHEAGPEELDAERRRTRNRRRRRSRRRRSRGGRGRDRDED